MHGFVYVISLLLCTWCVEITSEEAAQLEVRPEAADLKKIKLLIFDLASLEA